MESIFPLDEFPAKISPPRPRPNRVARMLNLQIRRGTFADPVFVQLRDDLTVGDLRLVTKLCVLLRRFCCDSSSKSCNILNDCVCHQAVCAKLSLDTPPEDILLSYYGKEPLYDNQVLIRDLPWLFPHLDRLAIEIVVETPPPSFVVEQLQQQQQDANDDGEFVNCPGESVLLSFQVVWLRLLVDWCWNSESFVCLLLNCYTGDWNSCSIS